MQRTLTLDPFREARAQEVSHGGINVARRGAEYRCSDVAVVVESTDGKKRTRDNGDDGNR